MECAIGWPKRYPWRSTLEVSGIVAEIAILKLCIVTMIFDQHFKRSDFETADKLC